MNPQQIIRQPRITEKSNFQQNMLNTYTFEVHPDANRVEVKKAIESLFGVKVLKVNTQNRMGKYRRFRIRTGGFSSKWKKALVTLAEGDVIEGV